jgi:hypothetical protein
MKVKELIEKLKQFDGDLIASISYQDQDWHIMNVEKGKAISTPNSFGDPQWIEPGKEIISLW